MTLSKDKFYFFKERAQPETLRKGNWFIEQKYDVMRLVTLDKYYAVDRKKKVIIGEIIDEVELINLPD